MKERKETGGRGGGVNGLLERTHKTHTFSNVAARYKTKQRCVRHLLRRVNAYRHTGRY